jgi:hypothetical protein
MAVRRKYEEPLARLREAKEIWHRTIERDTKIIRSTYRDSLRARVDIVIEAEPDQAGPKRFRDAVVELAALAHLHQRSGLRDDAMSVAYHLTGGESRHCRCGGKCGKSKSGNSTLALPARAAEIVHEVLRSPGEPLNSASRAILQDYFNADLGEVRVHSDALAAEALDAMKAPAFAIGNHVVLEPGFASGPPQTLLVHEVTHVLQQKTGGKPTKLQIRRDLPCEREANRAAAAFPLFIAAGERTSSVLSLTPSETAVQQGPFPAQCLDICPLRVASRFPPTPCLLTNCERLGFFPPIIARSWCVYTCPGNWEGPEAAWLINTIFGQVGPYYTS